jgi:putative hydrolase of the HAD superfamily
VARIGRNPADTSTVNDRTDTVFLDAGGVLVVPNWDRVSDSLARHGLHVAADVLRQVEPAARFALDTARVETTTDGQRGGDYFNDLLDRADVPRGPAREAALRDVYAYHMAHNLWEHVPDDVVPTLERLRAAGLKLAVASNANGVLDRCFERTGLTQYFDVICDSSLEGVEKPDPRFFQILLQRTGSRPETTIHVGDVFHVDVVGARRAGIRPVLIDPRGWYAGCDVDRISRLADLIDYLGLAA